MKASDILIDKLKQVEGYRAKAYRCPAGVWTCGYGHTKSVTARTVCDKAKAEEWLRADLAPIESFLSAIPEICKTQGRFDACADFCFNVGINAFRSSTLLKRIRRKESVAAIQAEFLKWVYAGGKPLEGLKTRRRWEAARWAE
jgi:lysozyme